MRRPYVLLAALAAYLGLSAAPASAATSIVQVGPPFSPSPITISAGDTVRFGFTSGFHSVTDDNGLFDSGGRGAGAFFEYTYTIAGTYPYHCVYHQAAGHLGQVIVSSVPPPDVPEFPLPAAVAGLSGLTLTLGVWVRRRRAPR